MLDLRTARKGGVRWSPGQVSVLLCSSEKHIGCGWHVYLQSIIYSRVHPWHCSQAHARTGCDCMQKMVLHAGSSAACCQSMLPNTHRGDASESPAPSAHRACAGACVWTALCVGHRSFRRTPAGTGSVPMPGVLIHGAQPAREHARPASHAALPASLLSSKALLSAAPPLVAACWPTRGVARPGPRRDEL
eukprot:365424-Chlamydomonas_euryale.AAC.23